MTTSIRRATAADVPIITVHRRAMFEEIGGTDRAALDRMDERFPDWLRGRIENGEYRGWLVTREDSTVVAGVGLWLQVNLPSPRDQSAQRAYVLNVYTHPDHRRQGHARRQMNTVIEWCREQGIRTVMLHASDAGRALYESMGFRQTNEMRILLSANE